MATKITPRQVAQHLRATGATSIGDTERLAGIDTNNRSERLELWTKFRHLWGGPSQPCIDAVMAECHRRAARMVNAGKLSLVNPRAAR